MILQHQNVTSVSVLKAGIEYVTPLSVNYSKNNTTFGLITHFNYLQVL